jgi:hypothetical protein
MRDKTRIGLFSFGFVSLLALAGCSKGDGGKSAEATAPGQEPAAAEGRNLEETQGIVLLRGLPTLETQHSVAVVELDPEASNFGEILQEFEFTGYEAPLHHLYYSPSGRLYSTGLDPGCSLAEVALSRDATGAPEIQGIECLDTGGQQVGEDIMWHSVNGTQYMFVTFMGGTGVEQADGGSIGVFDPQSNQVIKIIEARKSQVGEGKPYIMYPHGISAYGDRMVVTSTVHPDLATGVGNAITVIDLNTLEPIENIVVEDAKPVGFPSSPVEVLFVRPSISERANPACWSTRCSASRSGSSTTTRPTRPSARRRRSTTASPRTPGFRSSSTATRRSSSSATRSRRRQALSARQLARLVPAGPDIQAEPGAHHMIFFKTPLGPERHRGAEQPAEPRQRRRQRSDRRRFHRQGERSLDHGERPGDRRATRRDRLQEPLPQGRGESRGALRLRLRASPLTRG